MRTSAVVAVVRRWEAAIQAGNIDAILDNHTDDILMYDVPEPLVLRGLEDYRATWDLFYRYGAPGSDVFVVEDLSITAGADVAFATGLLRIGGSKQPVCRLTLGLVKQDHQWLIAHEHHSAPHPAPEPGEPG